MSKLIRFGIIGLGGRGRNNAGDVILSLPDTDITAVCDLYPDRMDMMADVVKEKRGHDVFKSADYNEILKRDDVDAVYIATSWESHVEIATAAIKAGMPSGSTIFELFISFSKSKYSSDQIALTSIVFVSLHATSKKVNVKSKTKLNILLILFSS